MKPIVKPESLVMMANLFGILTSPIMAAVITPIPISTVMIQLQAVACQLHHCRKELRSNEYGH